MRVSESVRLRLRSSERNGYLRTSDLGPDTFSGLCWVSEWVNGEPPQDESPTDRKRVVVDLTQITGFGVGVVEVIARQLVQAGVEQVQVEGDQKPSVRAQFRKALDQAIVDAEKVLR